MIAIHNKKNSFSELWIDYCSKNNIPYKTVNCYQSNIISQLSDCDALMWHHHHGDYKDNILAKQLLFSLQHAGVVVFPDFNTNWHFDDKVGQKYLFESIGAPSVPSFVFYDKEDAFSWVRTTNYPKVFKLRGGAGSANVKLVNNQTQAILLVRKAFGKGFPAFDRWSYCKDRCAKFLNGSDTLVGALKGIGRLFVPVKNIHLLHHEKGYIYFQDFIPNNESDTRVIIIGGKAFAIKRLVRKNDFRASGSGSIIHKNDEIDIRCVKIAFETSEKLKSQCIAYDFIFNHENSPLIVEISYGFSPAGYSNCPGYWDRNLLWHEGAFNPYGWMVEMILSNK
ncbi:MAG: hypothetical protein RBS07_12630 [Lentimicrobium sp.]|jgi:glutathione synthase/RimK-type ligase-like ATP-grasp enzyme|nr:hypothetical protein [Lentimicrobium sp.]